MPLGTRARRARWARPLAGVMLLAATGLAPLAISRAGAADTGICRDDRPVRPADRTAPVFVESTRVAEIAIQGDKVFWPPSFPPTLSLLRTNTRLEADLRALDPDNIDPARSLLLTDLTIVEDDNRTYDPITGRGRNPLGKWTFAFLMSQLAETARRPIDPVQFIRAWLADWERADPVNGWPGEALVTPGPGQTPDEANRIVDAWRQLSGGAALALDKAPFRLLAIVNRIDLRDERRGRIPLDYAGELRFVFGAVAPDAARGTALDFLVILEYGVEYPGGARAWAKQWCRLGLHRLGSAEYLASLTELTDHVTTIDRASGRRPTLSQIRTNENVLVQRRREEVTWQLRQFRLTRDGALRRSAVSRNPGWRRDGTTLLRDYVDQDAATIGKPGYEVPARYGGLPFRGDVAEARWMSYWYAPPTVDLPTMQRFAVRTCSGCHHRETKVPREALDPASFAHVLPREAGRKAAVSSFLEPRPTTVPDPRRPTEPVRPFEEIRRRQCYLDSLVKGLVTTELCATPRATTH